MELERLNKQILLFEKAYKTLESAFEKKSFNELEKDWVIQRFEYTIELSWKTLKRILEYELSDSNLFPKEIFKEFYKKWLISDLELWFNFLQIRNYMSHMYSEYNSNDSFNFIKKNYKSIWELVEIIKKRFL